MSDFERNANSQWGFSGVTRAGHQAIDQGLRAYMIGVYNYMMLGLGLTALVALGVSELAVGPGRSLTPLGIALYTTPLHYVVIFAPLLFVFFFSFRIGKMSAGTARSVFLLFSASMGLSLSSIFLVYTGESIVQAFFVTTAAFGALSLYGYTTSRDLSAVGSFLLMGLVGLILASLVNLFLQSSAMQFALSCLSVLIFAGLTAWDTQWIKSLYWESDGYEVATKKSIYGALSLYLDFINIFMSLLQLTGNRNQ